MRQVEVSHNTEMAGPFNRGDTIISKHFTFFYFLHIFTFVTVLNNFKKENT